MQALRGRVVHDGSMSERIRFIDALRGISLAGIVMAHFGERYLGFMPPPGRPYNIHGMADGVLEALSWIFVRGKGFGIFSFMFGLSFALQMQRADRRAPGTDFRSRFVWRLLILFAIGWLHGLLYSGDILTVYAALGIPLILFYRVRDRWLLILALLLLIGVPRITQRVVQGPTTQIELQPLQTRMNAEAEAHWQALAAGGRVRHRPAARDDGLPVQVGLPIRILWTRVPDVRALPSRALGGTTPGVRGRRDAPVAVPTDLALDGCAHVAHPPARRCSLRGGPRDGLRSTRTGGRRVTGHFELAPRDRHGVLRRLEQRHDALLRGVVRAALPSTRWQSRILYFGPVGRMALSVYISQTVIGVLVFFGFGLGLLGRFGNTVTIPMGIALFALQVSASRAWLARFRFGPLEWVWRSLTWLRREPFRLSPNEPAPSSMDAG